MDKLNKNKIICKSLKTIFNEKGSVLHFIRNDEEDFTNFGECYFSEIKPKIIKGWKLHKLQTQNLVVPIGIIKVVITNNLFDNNFIEYILGQPNNYSRLTIPPNYWYGFKCLSAQTALIANCPDLPHDPLESEYKNYEELDLKYKW